MIENGSITFVGAYKKILNRMYNICHTVNKEFFQQFLFPVFHRNECILFEIRNYQHSHIKEVTI